MYLFPTLSRTFCLAVRAFTGVSLLYSSISICAATEIFLNEIHYDNSGSDTNEGVEVAGPAGQDLTGWQLLFYNGNGGNLYSSLELSGIIPDEGNGFGALFFDASGLQNGPDGIALADAAESLIQFVSYEGSFMATEGLAAGLISELIGAFENGRGTSLESLQLSGSGTRYADFQWVGPLPQSFGALNGDQVFTPSVTPVPAPATLLLFLSGLTGMGWVARRGTAPSSTMAAA